MSGVFVNVNRGKRSVVLDLRSEAGKTALRALIKEADVFIHSMRAKAIGKLGFGYEEVAAINPRDRLHQLLRLWPARTQTGTCPPTTTPSRRSADIPAVQEQLTGEANYVGTIMADKVAGLTALYATMMALFHRERTGEGQEVEVSMFETMASFMLVEHANGRDVRSSAGSRRLSADGGAKPQAVPHQRRLHRRADLQRQAMERVRRRRAAAVGRRAIRHARAPGAPDRHRLLAGGRDAAGAHHRRNGWHCFANWRSPQRRCDTPAELFDNPHLNAVGLFETVDTPHGQVRFPGVPTWFSRTPGRVAGPAPRAWRRHRDVLEEIGLDRPGPARGRDRTGRGLRDGTTRAAAAR